MSKIILAIGFAQLCALGSSAFATSPARVGTFATCHLNATDKAGVTTALDNWNVDEAGKIIPKTVHYHGKTISVAIFAFAHFQLGMSVYVDRIPAPTENVNQGLIGRTIAELPGDSGKVELDVPVPGESDSIMGLMCISSL